MAKAKTVMPKPVKYNSRICFGIAYFESEADAKVYADDVVRRCVTYNGGWFHGESCRAGDEVGSRRS